MRAARRTRSAEAKAAGRETTYSAAGLAAVWADANTREAIYDALRRKETFATSGTRIGLRFFGGWGFAPGLVQAQDFVAQAYASGVPMGSMLPAAPAQPGAPRFAVLATKDPQGAQPRPRADHQGLAGCARQGAREDFRCRLGRRACHRCHERQAPAPWARPWT